MRKRDGSAAPEPLGAARGHGPPLHSLATLRFPQVLPFPQFPARLDFPRERMGRKWPKQGLEVVGVLVAQRRLVANHESNEWHRLSPDPATACVYGVRTQREVGTKAKGV